MSYYATGFFKAKSTKILSKEKLESLINKSDEKFFESLRNYGFGFNDSVEELYVREIKTLKKDLIDALGDLKGFKIFFYTYDILNTKLIYKELKENIDNKNYYIEGGNIEPHLIVQALKYHNFTDLKEYEDLFTTISNIKETNYQKINYIIDNLFIDKMKKEVKNIKPLNDYLNVKLDVMNLLSIIRAKKLSLGEDFLEYAIVETKTLTKKEFISLYNKSLEEIITKCNSLGYFSVKRSVEDYRRTTDLESLESNFEKNLYEILIDYSYEASGVGYIMSYVYLKLMELKNIKIIYYNRQTAVDKLFI